MTAKKAARSRGGCTSSPSPDPSEEDRSKDAFFAQVAELAEAMIARHGSDFAIGTFVLAAKFIAEGKPLANQGSNGDEVKETGS